MLETSVHTMAVTFEPSKEELVRTAAQLVACSDSASIFDNSVSSRARRSVRDQCAKSGILWLGDGRNAGTARPLNDAVARSLAAGVEWTLYVDQDSVMAEGYKAAVYEAMQYASNRPDVVVVGSQVWPYGLRDDVSSSNSLRFRPVRYVIASGMLFRNRAVAALGGFDEGMFLDTVDHELCLRVRAAGLAVLRDNGRRLYHTVGDDCRRLPLWRNWYVSMHPTWRRELMWRNSAVLFRRYVRHFPRDCARHIGVRTVDTLAGAVMYGQPGYLTAAVRGVVASLRGLTGSELVDR